MKIRTHRDLEVYCIAFDASMKIFEFTKGFPKEETYSLTDQIRRSTRSVNANIAEAFRKRRYPKAFISKIADAEAEAAESQNWLDYAYKCGYLNRTDYETLDNEYDNILGKLVKMSLHPENWSW